MLYSKQIELGLQYIANNQLKNGGFNSWSSSESDFKSHKLYKTTFIASTILGCLSGFKNSNAKSIRERLFQYLLTQKTDNWSFNYWDNTSKQYATHPYPDDLDDTFCALAALHQHDEHVLSPDALALITHLLIACEKEVGGPYKTWLVSDSAPHVWQDIDLAVKANIAHFLSLKNIKLKNLNRFI
jgi:prenyltransferase beta subunit